MWEMSGRSESRSETPRSNEHLKENNQNIDIDNPDVSKKKISKKYYSWKNFDKNTSI